MTPTIFLLAILWMRNMLANLKMKNALEFFPVSLPGSPYLFPVSAYWTCDLYGIGKDQRNWRKKGSGREHHEYRDTLIKGFYHSCADLFTDRHTRRLACHARLA